MKRWLLIFIVSTLLSLGVAPAAKADASLTNAVCDDARIFQNVFSHICWDCFLDNLSLFGIGNPPAGAASRTPICSCQDNLGVPEFGWPLSFWSPQRLIEVTTIPWCSPSLGGLRLQKSLESMGTSSSGFDGPAGQNRGFFHHHYFAYPIMSMLEIFLIPSCQDEYVDFDLMYVSEIDPLWNNEMLALLLNPEAIIFSNPLALAYCAADCVSVTANKPLESTFPCAGCDGNLYPLTGFVIPQPDAVAGTSLIAQRTLAALHRRGLARKTMGNAARCEREFAPMIPRSQYRFSMIYPVPEAQAWADQLDGLEFSEDESASLAGEIDAGLGQFGECCHPMGMSTSRWCLPVGGRNPPGKDKSHVYLIWNYQDCCIRM